MRRSRAKDWWLLATLLPLYLLVQGAAIDAHLASGARLLPVRSLTGAQGADGYPLVFRVFRPETGEPLLQRGDTLIRLGSLDLRGLSRAEVMHRAIPLLRQGLPFEAEIERDGERFRVTTAPVPNPNWWWTIPVWGSLALTAVFLLLRAPHWRLSRSFFIGALAYCCFGTVQTLAPVHPSLSFLGWVVGGSVGVALLLYTAFDWTGSTRAGAGWRAFSCAIGLCFAAKAAAYWLLTPPLGLLPARIDSFFSIVTMPIALGAMTMSYRRAGSLERRQLRWILFGLFVGILPRSVVMAVSQFVSVWNGMLWDQVSVLFVSAIPLGVAVSVVGYRWLDIDRLISSSAALTILGVVLVGGALAVVPPVARTASAALGVDPEAGRLALSMALAAVLVPGYRVLRPWLDQRLFAAQHTLAERFTGLRAELAACRGLEELAERAGEGLDALLRPDSIATYARAGEAFTPLFVRGRALPPAFEAGCTLAQVLETKGAPLFARAKGIGPFERAALETLGAEVVVPVLRDGQLVAFTCLAGKRSGDIYTASDLTLLAGVAERSADVLARLDADTVAREAQAMQSALRRYVPGAVAERVLAGDALEPAEREVSVLFVDIRDYTRVTQGLQPADVFATLNEHTERVSATVQACGGTIVEFNGDGLMAVFGAPEALPKKEQQAVEAARKIVDSMPHTLAVGVGVATGEAFVGSIRSTDRLIWSAVGSTTNLASRLQSMTRDLSASIALDETTRERAGYVCADFTRHESLAIRGRTGRLDVFTLPLAGRETRAGAAR